MPTGGLRGSNPPAEVCIGSGGPRGTLFLGAASCLQREGYFDAATTFSGASVGAVIAAGLVLGRNCRNMLEIAIKHPIQPDIVPGSFGFDTGKGLAQFIRRLLGLRKKMTLADMFARTGKTLRICVCNVSKKRAEYWTHETHPNVSLVHALRISCSVPFMFSAVRYRGDLFVDGAIADHLPCSCPKNAIAIELNTPPKPIDTGVDFVDALRACAIPRTSPAYHVKIDPGHVDPFDFAPTPKDSRTAFDAGKKQAAQWVKKVV